MTISSRAPALNSPVAPVSISPWPLAARLASLAVGPNEWRVLIVPAGQENAVALQMVEELCTLGDLAVAHEIAGSAADLLRIAKKKELVVVSGLHSLSEAQWQAVDLARSRLTRALPILLVIADREVERISRLAPNLWSWLSSGVWTFEPESGLGEDAREQRLTELRRHYGFGDAEVLRRARERELAPDPDFAEWLLLLGEKVER